VSPLPRGLALAHVDALPDPCALVIEIACDGGFASLIVTRKGAIVSAFRNKCPHAGYPLQRSDGRIVVQEGRFMICGGHSASFRLEDGACAGGPCNGDPLERVAIEISDGVVMTR